MIRTLAPFATMGTQPGKVSWTVEVACAIPTVIVGSFALMLSIGLVLGGLSAGGGEPYRTFGDLVGAGYRVGLVVAAFTCPLPILASLLAQVVPWAHFRQDTDPILLAIERARVRLVLLAFLPVVPLAGVACGCLAAMEARNPLCEILVASTVPGWINSQVLELVVLLSLASGVVVFIWVVMHGFRRVTVLVEPDEDTCRQCQYCIAGLERCPECGKERRTFEVPGAKSGG